MLISFFGKPDHTSIFLSFCSKHRVGTSQKTLEKDTQRSTIITMHGTPFKLEKCSQKRLQKQQRRGPSRLQLAMQRPSCNDREKALFWLRSYACHWSRENLLRSCDVNRLFQSRIWRGNTENPHIVMHVLALYCLNNSSVIWQKTLEKTMYERKTRKEKQPATKKHSCSGKKRPKKRAHEPTAGSKIPSRNGSYKPNG